MQKLKVLMLDNIASVPWNLKKGLEAEGHLCHILFDKSGEDHKRYLDGVSTPESEILDSYDIVHLHYPYHLWKLKYVFRGRRLILHWHGSDARVWWRGFLVKWCLKRIANAQLYSTPDIGENVFLGCTDTDKFKPMSPGMAPRGKIAVWGCGIKHRVPREGVPKYLNRYEEWTMYPADNLSPELISIIALEAAACGCKITHHPYMNRKWILENASIPAATKRILKIYEKVL